MAKEKQISIPQIGMKRTLSPHLLQEGDFAFQLNGNNKSESGDLGSKSDEPSNILAVNFPVGYKVIGVKNHVVRNKTYVFLTNPETGVSEIGCIVNDRAHSLPTDTLQDNNCSDCPSQVNVEPVPLENQTQIAHQNYQTLLSDECNLCLGFDINNPIVDIIIKEQNIGTKMFWTSTPGDKEFRYIELDDIEKYKRTGNENCDNEPTPTCIDCEKLKVFRPYSFIKDESYERVAGGNLKKGSYELLAAYSDVLGNELTNYMPISPIIPIFDEANIIHEQEDNNAITNFSIRVRLKDIDQRFEYYKVVYRYYTSNGVFSSFVEGIHTVSDVNIILSNNNEDRITSQEIAVRKPFVESVDGATEVDNMMVLNGIKEREPINLQPVMSLAGVVLKWMSFSAKEDLYSNANSYKYVGYNRGENQMFAIDFGFNDGYRTNSYIFIPNPATQEENADVEVNDDTNSINAIVDNCDGNLRTKKYHFYNTATEIGQCPNTDNIPTVTQTEVVETFTKAPVPSVPANSLSINLSEVNEFVGLEFFIESSLENLAALGPIRPYVDLNNLNSFQNPPILPVITCNPYTLLEEEVEVENIENEQIEFTYAANTDEYATVTPPSNTFLYEIDGEDSRIDEDISYGYASAVILPNSITPFIRKRIDGNYNGTCNQSSQLQRVNQDNLQNVFGNFYFKNQGALTIAELQNQNITMPNPSGDEDDINGLFTNRMHKNALWYKTEVYGREEFYINISEASSCKRETITFNGVNINFGKNKAYQVRVSLFASCNQTTPISSEIIDIRYHKFIKIDSTIINALTSEQVYVSIETSIKKSTGLGPDWENFVDNSDYNNPKLENGGTFVTTYIANLPCGAFNIVDRDREPETANVTWDTIELFKRQKYRTECQYEVPILNDCEPVPNRYGEFGHYESTDKYPDNKELYDSSGITIDKSKITNVDLLDKLSVYIDTDDGTTITLSDSTDFTCQNIRAYKMPDNKVSPFMRTQVIASNSETVIHPLGVTIDGEAINNLLDVAVDNNLLTTEQRESIVDYKIYRADSSLDRSIVASGIVFNTKKYTVEGEDIRYFNHPFNSLGKDKFFPENNDNPFDDFQVVSPEFDFFRPSLPTEMSIEAYMFGKSNSRILPVENHAKMVILGRRARTLATILAALESAAELAIQLAQSSEVYRVALPLAPAVNPVGIGFHIAAIAAGTLDVVTRKVGRYRYEWLNTFENLGTPYNFGYYIAAGSNYNYIKTLQTDGDRLRGLSVKKYLKPGILNISDTTTGSITKINNRDREYAPYFSLGNFPINNIDPSYENFDNSDVTPNFSSQLLSSEIGCHKGKSPEQLRNIASPYVQFKNYVPNQYGTVNSIKWVDTTYCIDINTTGVCNGVLGGDTFITRHSKWRKTRIFETDLLGSADLTPFPYKFQSNYGEEPKYYIDFKINSEFTAGSQLFPNIFYDVQTDCGNSDRTFYVEPPSKFYLYTVGYTNFLCETRINTSFRNARKEPWNQFYPQNTDYEIISQPDTVALTRPESYFYNKAYLQSNIQNTTFLLPEYYSKEDEAKKAYNINSGIYSVVDANENSITEPYLIYRPNDKFTLTSKFGNLTGLKGIESGQILMYYENATELQNSTNPFTDGSTEYNAELGNGGVFGKRAITLSTTDIGYGGSQSKQTLSCEFGHFHADMKRGQVFVYQGDKKLNEISRYSNGKPNGMDTWFKEHLPLKFTRIFPKYKNTDNSYNGIGITWGYDSKFRRVILTKKDYIVKKGLTMTYNESSNLFFEGIKAGTTFQENVDNGNFKDVSWTITYKPEEGNWESYMSYTPNYYINHTDYFQSGKNTDNEENGLWSHLLTNKSHRVFYGHKFSYIVEYPVKNQYLSKRLEAIDWNAQLRRYHNEYDYATIEENPFDYVTIFNDYENSGKLKTVKNKGTLSQLSKYPITNSDNTQDVLVSYDNYRYGMDYFYNRVKSNKNNQPIWLWDENQIEKTINNQAVSFYGKKTLERMKGNYFMVRLERNGNTNYDLDLRWSEQTVNPIR